MTRTARIAAAGAGLAALAALAAPTLALGQAAATPTLKEDSDSQFPDKVFTVQLPRKATLQGRHVTVTENGVPVSSLAVTAPGGRASGAILLIDASNSMKGAPIAAAMEAARAFMAQRTADLPVAVIAYNPDVTVLTDFTTNADELAAAVAKAPPLALGTHVYDALIEAAKLAKDEGLDRTTAVLLSDGNRRGVQASLPDTLEALNDANVRVVSVGLKSPLYDESTLTTLAKRTGGGYVGSHTPAQLEAIFGEISARISREYLITYRSLLPPQVKAEVAATITGFEPATATYTTPTLDVAPRGTFEKSWIDQVITSPWLMLFVAVSVLALVAFALLTAVDVRNRSLRRRMAQYVTVPSEDESRLRRAEVAAILADTAQKTVGGQRWWQRFEADVELSGIRLSPLAIAGWTVVGGIVASLATAIVLQNLWGLLVGILAPFVTRWFVSRQVRKRQNAFAEQLPENLDVLAGAMRTGHSTMGALSVMVDSADEPSKSEYRRVVQDEHLGVPLDDALMVMARRMKSYDAEQIALVMRLQREAGGNTAEVLDRVAEVIRGRMELRRLVDVLTAQARISRWILTGLPIFVLLSLSFTGGDYLDPMTGTLVGKVALVAGAVMILIGSLWIKRIAKLDV